MAFISKAPTHHHVSYDVKFPRHGPLQAHTLNFSPQIAQQAVGLRCYNNVASTCQPGEVHLGSHCYSLDYNSDMEEGRGLFEASEKCFEYGGHLLDLNTQVCFGHRYIDFMV